MLTDPDKLRIVVDQPAVERRRVHRRRRHDPRPARVATASSSRSSTPGPHPGRPLPRIFDRFSRADDARSGGVHCGVGLALVRALCDVLGLSASAENGDDGSVRFILQRQPRARGEEPGGASKSAASR